MTAAGITPSQLLPVTLVILLASARVKNVDCQAIPHCRIARYNPAEPGTTLHQPARSFRAWWLDLLLQDVGCEVAAVREDAFYSGLPQRRVRGEEYNSLVDGTITALRER